MRKIFNKLINQILNNLNKTINEFCHFDQITFLIRIQAPINKITHKYILQS